MPSKPSKVAKKVPSFCANCGQKVKGAIAEKAGVPGIIHCCRCGMQVDAQGRCQNDPEVCTEAGRVPHC